MSHIRQGLEIIRQFYLLISVKSYDDDVTTEFIFNSFLQVNDFKNIV